MKCRHLADDNSLLFKDRIKNIEDRMMENDTTNKEELTQLLNEANELYENIRGNISIQEKAIITDKKENILMTFSVNKKKDYNDIVERMYKYI